jgi:hypothetical protein
MSGEPFDNRDVCETGFGEPPNERQRTLVDMLLNPWLWSPSESAVEEGFWWPDYSRDAPRWACFVIFIAFVLAWVGLIDWRSGAS